MAHAVEAVVAGLADELGAYVDDGCCIKRLDGSRCAVLGSVTYDELLTPRCAPPPPRYTLRSFEWMREWSRTETIWENKYYVCC